MINAVVPRAPVELGDWYQGDCHVGSETFIHRFNRALPCTPFAEQLVAEDGETCEVDVEGFALLTHTCDLRRDSNDRPYVEVAPLVKVEEGVLKEVEKRRNLQFLYIPGIADLGLVAHLERSMTVEKGVVAAWARTTGCANDTQRRQLAETLTRKRGRFAFPDAFGEFVHPLVDLLKKKATRAGLEGRALQSLDEIRVSADPDWETHGAGLFFWFVRAEDQGGFEGCRWDEILDSWLEMLSPNGRFSRVEGTVVEHADMSAADYIRSSHLDLDYLTPSDE